MDTGNNTLSKEMKNKITLTNEKIEEHYNHMCKAGYDPLLCMDRVYSLIIRTNDSKVPQSQIRHKTQFVDRIITVNRYKDLLKFGKVNDIALLDDIIFIPIETVIVADDPYMLCGTAAIFWLRPPAGCRTLGEMYKKYEKKITDELRNKIVTR